MEQADLLKLAVKYTKQGNIMLLSQKGFSYNKRPDMATLPHMDHFHCVRSNKKGKALANKCCSAKVALQKTNKLNACLRQAQHNHPPGDVPVRYNRNSKV